MLFHGLDMKLAREVIPEPLYGDNVIACTAQNSHVNGLSVRALRALCNISPAKPDQPASGALEEAAFSCLFGKMFR